MWRFQCIKNNCFQLLFLNFAFVWKVFRVMNFVGSKKKSYWDNPKSLRALNAVAKAMSSGFFCMKAAINSTKAGRQHGSFLWNVQYLQKSNSRENRKPISRKWDLLTDAETLMNVRSSLISRWSKAWKLACLDTWTDYRSRPADDRVVSSWTLTISLRSFRIYPWKENYLVHRFWISNCFSHLA